MIVFILAKNSSNMIVKIKILPIQKIDRILDCFSEQSFKKLEKSIMKFIQNRRFSKTTIPDKISYQGRNKFVLFSLIFSRDFDYFRNYRVYLIISSCRSKRINTKQEKVCKTILLYRVTLKMMKFGYLSNLKKIEIFYCIYLNAYLD